MSNAIKEFMRQTTKTVTVNVQIFKEYLKKNYLRRSIREILSLVDAFSLPLNIIIELTK